MIEMIVEMLSYSFMRRALIAGLLVALCSALLGVTLVLKRYSMIGDGLSHVGFGAACVAMALNVAPLKISVPVVIIAAFLLMRINDNAKIKGDAAIALISSTAIATGVIAASLTTGLNTDVSGYMFGSILLMGKNDIIACAVLSAAVLVLYVVFYNRIFAVTFDETDATFFVLRERERVWGTEYYAEECLAAAEEVAGGQVALTYFPNGGQVIYETSKPLQNGMAVRLEK